MNMEKHCTGWLGGNSTGIKGAILGDIIGSAFEFKKPSEYDYKTVVLLTESSHFTDDTVMTLATKHALRCQIPFATAYKLFGRTYPDAGYGEMFEDWINEVDESIVSESYGSGAAMRISPIVEHSTDISTMFDDIEASALCSHGSPEGTKGANVAAGALKMAMDGISKGQILSYAIACYPVDQYKVSPWYSVETLREKYQWSDLAQDVVPLAIRCAIEAESFEDFMRRVISIDCDADTVGAIGGAIAEEFFKDTNDPLLNCADEIIGKYLDDYLWNEYKAEVIA